MGSSTGKGTGYISITSPGILVELLPREASQQLIIWSYDLNFHSSETRGYFCVVWAERKIKRLNASR
jgi:hypothetical protein